MNELTGENALIILNSHIDNVIKGTCGKSQNEPSWGLNEINGIINCIGTIKNSLDELAALRQEKAEQNIGVVNPPEGDKKKGK